MHTPLSTTTKCYFAPDTGSPAGGAATALGVLHSRPVETDIVAHLIHTGQTPATESDVRQSFTTLFDRDATAFEEILACEYVDSFGLLAR